MNLRTIFFAAVVSALPLVVGAQSVADKALGVSEFSAGDWEVRIKSDPMTDARICTAVLKNKYHVQASKDSLMVSFRGRGGVSGYEMRFDDLPVGGMHLPTKVEKDMSTVIIRGVDFNIAKQHKRLRLQVVPVLRGLLFEDISLDGFSGAVNYVRERCA